MGLTKAVRNLKRENEVRRVKTAQVRKDKVILGYIMKNYRKVYEEGQKYAQELAQLYPDKIDLTKTPEYKGFVKGPHIEDNMELKIKLLDKPATSATKTHETFQALQTAETFKDLEAATLNGEQPSDDTNLLPLSEEEFNTIIHDLGQEPFIQDFFANIDFQVDECPLW